MLDELRKDLKKVANPKKAKALQKFFQTHEGGYGEGDLFLGPTVPQLRVIARKFKTLPLPEVQSLLNSKWHEERMISLFILADQFEKGDEKTQEKIFNLYLKNTKYINNWDLVDCSAPQIVGGYLVDRPKDILLKLTSSKLLWDRRIAMVATYYFIRFKNNEWAFKIAEILLPDREDLIQKAVGWMLREAGKKNFEELEQFLRLNYKNMGRTCLRYAIEKFPQDLRLAYLHGTI